jgi:hypothetical protein
MHFKDGIGHINTTPPLGLGLGMFARAADVEQQLHML